MKKMKKDFFKDSSVKFPAYEPWISNDDKRIVNTALDQTMLTFGPQLEKFESDFSKYTKAKYAIAVSNCTAVLYNLEIICFGNIKHFVNIANLTVNMNWNYCFCLFCDIFFKI